MRFEILSIALLSIMSGLFSTGASVLNIVNAGFGLIFGAIFVVMGVIIFAGELTFPTEGKNG